MIPIALIPFIYGIPLFKNTRNKDLSLLVLVLDDLGIIDNTDINANQGVRIYWNNVESIRITKVRAKYGHSVNLSIFLKDPNLYYRQLNNNRGLSNQLNNKLGHGYVIINSVIISNIKREVLCDLMNEYLDYYQSREREKKNNAQ